MPMRFLLCLLALFSQVCFAAAPGEEQQPASAAVLEEGVEVASVVIDGEVLFRLRGIAAFPAEKRAQVIEERIRSLARDPAFQPDSLRIVDSPDGVAIMARTTTVVVVRDIDAAMEGIGRRDLAAAYVASMMQAIQAYRDARTHEALMDGAAKSGVATAVFIAILWLILWAWRRMNAVIERRYRQRIHSVGIQSFQILRAERIWAAGQGLLRAARIVAILVAGYLYLRYALAQFPWTRGPAAQMMEYVTQPVAYLGRGAVGLIPNLIFLTILYLITRYALKVMHLFFGAVGRGEVRLSGFEIEWAEPTYKLVRLMVLVLALVVAYPYIPGSQTDAFKGLSIFIGIVFSLGSSSAIANMIAGYMMTYRRAFRIGDRIKVQDVVGDVTEMRLQVTHLRTVKNEEVIVPNSTILNNEVVNYSALASRDGLILHTTVGIGYETPWRQVEAMLIMAAARTSGLKTEPAPFVRHQSLADFAVNYELNVYCDNPQAMGLLYTELHRNILDVFNEYGVQIMTPAYEGDPAEAKVVPKEQWFTAPAQHQLPSQPAAKG